MASSSVSQESIEIEDYDLCIRRSRIRMMRGRTTSGAHRTEYHESMESGDHKDGLEDEALDVDTNGVPGDHESPTRLASRLKDKQRIRPNHLHKGKAVKDKRKLREKRRSTGVVHLQQPSTEQSTGDSLDEDHETRKNTAYNEFIDEDNPQTPEEERKAFAARSVRNKSPSDLEADFEDNQDYDSTVSQSESNLATLGSSSSNGNQQSDSPVRKAQACAASRIMNSQTNSMTEASRVTSGTSRETTPTATKSMVFGKTSRVLERPAQNTVHNNAGSALQSSQRVTTTTKSNTSRALHTSQGGGGDAVTDADNRRVAVSPRLAANQRLAPSQRVAASQRVHWQTPPPSPVKTPPKSPVKHHTSHSERVVDAHHTSTDTSPSHTSPTHSTPTRTTPTHATPSTAQQSYSLADLALRMRELEMALTHERLERQREKEERHKLQQLLLQREQCIHTLQQEVHFLQQDLENVDDDNKTLRTENETLLKSITQLSYD